MNAYDIQKWIDHLSEEEKQLPIQIRDDNGRYYNPKDIIHRLVPPYIEEGMDIPPQECFILNTIKYKTGEEVTKSLEQDTFIIHEKLETLHEKLSKLIKNIIPPQDPDLYATINDALNRIESIQYHTSTQDIDRLNERIKQLQLQEEYDINKLVKEVVSYRKEDQLDTLDDTESLIKAIVVESAELLDTITFKYDYEYLAGLPDELADILIYCFALANNRNLDVTQIVRNKICYNKRRNRKYPTKEE